MGIIKNLESLLLSTFLTICTAGADFLERNVCDFPGYQFNPRVSKNNKVVWVDAREGFYLSIYGKELPDRGEIKISQQDRWWDSMPSIENDNVVWFSYPQIVPTGQLYKRRWNYENEKPLLEIISYPGDFIPIISRNIVALSSFNPEENKSKVSFLDLETETMLPGNIEYSGFSPISFSEEWTSWNEDGNIFAYNYLTKEKRQITFDNLSKSNPFTDGKTIAYARLCEDGKKHVFAYDLETKQKRQRTNFPSNQDIQAVLGKRIAFSDDRQGNNNYILAVQDCINGERIICSKQGITGELSMSDEWLVYTRKINEQTDVFAARVNDGADVNGDCRVDVLDLLCVRNKLGQNPETGENWKADVNLDGKVDVLDLIKVRNNLGAHCH